MNVQCPDVHYLLWPNALAIIVPVPYESQIFFSEGKSTCESRNVTARPYGDLRGFPVLVTT